MAARPARFTQGEVKRALDGARAAGFRPSGFRIDPTGAISVTLGDGTIPKAANSNPWDEELLP